MTCFLLGFLTFSLFSRHKQAATTTIMRIILQMLWSQAKNFFNKLLNKRDKIAEKCFTLYEFFLFCQVYVSTAIDTEVVRWHQHQCSFGVILKARLFSMDVFGAMMMMVLIKCTSSFFHCFALRKLLLLLKMFGFKKYDGEYDDFCPCWSFEENVVKI